MAYKMNGPLYYKTPLKEVKTASENAANLAMANSDKRKKYRAGAQKARRAALKKGIDLTGKDWDHKTQSFVSIEENRGNRGKGTKTEGSNTYADPGYKKRT